MADAVDLVRAYLHLNGYFTVSEYPVLERLPGGEHRMVTDLDLLAFRFKGAGPVAMTLGSGPAPPSALLEPDPVLGSSREESDMIVAEVKEGEAQLNRAARDPRVLKAALTRFACCDSREVAQIVERLLRKGEAQTGHGHRIRMLAFGSTLPQIRSDRFAAISLGHVVAFLRAHLRDNWDLIRPAQLTDPALGFLSLIEKAERGGES